MFFETVYKFKYGAFRGGQKHWRGSMNPAIVTLDECTRKEEEERKRFRVSCKEAKTSFKCAEKKFLRSRGQMTVKKSKLEEAIVKNAYKSKMEEMVIRSISNDVQYLYDAALEGYQHVLDARRLYSISGSQADKAIMEEAEDVMDTFLFRSEDTERREELLKMKHLDWPGC